METAIGIDLGTTFSSVAVEQEGRATVLPDSQGNLSVPSVVAFPQEGGILVGYSARERLAFDPFSTVYSAKRLIGRRMSEAEARSIAATFPYPVVEGPNGHPVVELRGEQMSLPQISAHVLRVMKKTAEEHLGAPVERAVITVPANFNDAQRESTRIAGRIAGLEVIRILNEPTAAALAHAGDARSGHALAIYDFGGGSFDFTLLQVQSNFFRVITTAGDSFLGGDDFDEVLATAVANGFWKQTGIELRNDVVEWQRLRLAAEATKRELSTRTDAELAVTRVAHTAQGILDLSARVTREMFGSLCVELVRRSIAVCDQALGEVGVRPGDIDDVLLVGGTTHIPLVRTMVERYFGHPPRADVDPETAVAQGAAIQAASMMAAAHRSTPIDRVVLLDVLPQSIGVVTGGGQVERVLERRMAIPVTRSRVFSTSRDNRGEVRIRIVQGESLKAEENTPLGELVISGLRPSSGGEARVLVTFEVDESGILNVTAKESETGRTCKRSVRVSGELDSEGIARIELV